MTDDAHWKDGDLDVTTLFKAAISEGGDVKSKAGSKIEGFLDSLGVRWDLDADGDFQIQLGAFSVSCYLLDGFVLFQAPIMDVTGMKAKRIAATYEGLLVWNTWPEPVDFALIETDEVKVVVLRASIAAKGISKAQLAWILHSMEKVQTVWKRDIGPLVT